MSLCFPKAGKMGSGTDKRREGEGFVPGTEKDLNKNTQKETEAEEIPGIEENQESLWLLMRPIGEDD